MVSPYEDKRMLLSVHPNYANLIFDKKKTIELRRSFPLKYKGDVLIYATSPENLVIGEVKVQNVYKLQIDELWEKYGKDACIRKVKFDEYFKGKEHGYAIKITNINKYRNPLYLEDLGKSPPQSYTWLAQSEKNNV